MNERETARNFCDVWHHEWVEEYYGYKCSKCGDFIPYGCEPWMPDEDERYPMRTELLSEEEDE